VYTKKPLHGVWGEGAWPRGPLLGSAPAMLHTNLMALCFVEAEQWPIEV